VEGRHDRPPVSALDRDRLDVHRHVERPERRADEDQGARELRDVLGQGWERDGRAARQAAGGGDRTGAPARGGPAGGRHRQQRAGRDAEQRQAQLGLTGPDAVAHVRHPGHPAREQRAVDEEQRRDGDAGGAKRVS
jgi:hypothetical protein